MAVQPQAERVGVEGRVPAAPRAVVTARAWALVAMAGAALGGCGMSRQEFTVEFTDHWCTHLLTCGDAAELTFDGILTQEDCLDRETYDVSQWGLGCTFKASEATQCLEDMAVLTCPPGEGQLAEYPLSCSAVYVKCGDPGTPADDSDPAASDPEDSDAAQ